MKTKADFDKAEWEAKWKKAERARKEWLKLKRAGRRMDHDEEVEATGKCPLKGGCRKCRKADPGRYSRNVPWLGGSEWLPEDGILEPAGGYEGAEGPAAVEEPEVPLKKAA